VALQLFDLSLKLNGFPISEARRRLDAILSVPEPDYAGFIGRCKHQIADFHLKNNNLYRSLVPNGFSVWENLPVMKKSDLQHPLAERLSNGYTAKNVFLNKTSGSGGDPILFAKDKECHALIWANIMRRFAWHGIDFNHSLQARFYGMPLDFAANAKLRAKDFLSHRYRFNIFDFSDAGMAKMVAKFRRTKFDYINGYTNSVLLLAHYLERQNLILNEICPTLKVCVCTSEMLLDDDRKFLEKRLGVRIVNEYGAAELDVLAMEDASGIWRVNAETTFVEILDVNGNVVPYGTEGRIVVTSLYNKAHPMIRYDVGDSGMLDETSTAKFPVLKKLTGRTNDVAVLPSGKRTPGMTFYTITKQLFGDQDNVLEFTIRQTKTDTFDIDYVSRKPLESAETERMETVLTQYLEPGLTFNFNRTDAAARSKSGKLKQFTSLINE
jgi:phenylacetate-CoA ligase